MKTLPPTTLEAWTYEAIEELVRSSAYEDHFDWKEALPDSRDQAAKNRLVEGAAGMANVGGGFLIFGVKDKPNGADPLERIVGVEQDLEFAKRLGDLMGKADPPVPFRVSNPPPAVPDKKLGLPVVEVQGFLRPHCIDGRFVRRIPRQVVSCSATEVRDMILRREERESTLRLLIQELAQARDAVKAVEVSRLSDKMLGLRPIDTRLVAELHAQLHPLFNGAAHLSHELSSVRAQAEVYNANLSAVFARIGSARLALPNGSGYLHSTSLEPVYDSLRRIGSVPLPYRLEELAKGIAAHFGLEAPQFTPDADIAKRGY